MKKFTSTLADVRATAEKSACIAEAVEGAGLAIVECLKNGGTLFTCGNGGSAADAMHLTQELVGRYKKQRGALPSMCLNSDPCLLTCLANDFGYEHAFARAVAAHLREGDIVIGFTTSGNSLSVCNALQEANDRSVTTILVTGYDLHSPAANLKCNNAIHVPALSTARVQEIHTTIIHHWLEMVEDDPHLVDEQA